MLNSWSVTVQPARAARWAVALGVVLPLGIAIGVMLAVLWLLWLTVEWLHGQLSRLQQPAAERHAAALRIRGPGMVRRAPGDTRMIELTPPKR